MPLIPKTVDVTLGTTATSTANRVLAADPTVNRYIRGIYATNSGAATQISVGVGAAATLSSANANIASGVTVPANAASYPIVQYVGDGRKALGAGSLNEIMAFAIAATIILTVIYKEEAPLV